MVKYFEKYMCTVILEFETFVYYSTELKPLDLTRLEELGHVILYLLIKVNTRLRLNLRNNKYNIVRCFDNTGLV